MANDDAVERMSGDEASVLLPMGRAFDFGSNGLVRARARSRSSVKLDKLRCCASGSAKEDLERGQEYRTVEDTNVN